MAKRGTRRPQPRVDPPPIVENDADGRRVARAAQLFPAILLDLDSRVQAPYATWLQRVPDYTIDRSQARIFLEDTAPLFIKVVADLGLGHYRWLPKALMLEFHARALTQALREHRDPPRFRVAYDLPADLQWPGWPRAEGRPEAAGRHASTRITGSSPMDPSPQ